MWQHTTVAKGLRSSVEQTLKPSMCILICSTYNVKVPVNYQELKEAVVAFKSNGVIPIAFNCKAEGSYLYQNMAMMIGGKAAIEEPISGKQINPCFITAMEYMKELYELDAFPEDMYTKRVWKETPVYRKEAPCSSRLWLNRLKKSEMYKTFHSQNIDEGG
jgi:hypothetical protein